MNGQSVILPQIAQKKSFQPRHPIWLPKKVLAKSECFAEKHLESATKNRGFFQSNCPHLFGQFFT